MSVRNASELWRCSCGKETCDDDLTQARTGQADISPRKRILGLNVVDVGGLRTAVLPWIAYTICGQ